jgi:hypothetical protein
MKQIILWLLLMFSSLSSLTAQNIPLYTFNSFDLNYNTVLGGTVIASGANIDQGIYFASLPFVFNLDGTNYNNCRINSNGYLMFGGSSIDSSSSPLATNTSNLQVVSAFGMDLKASNSSTQIKVLVTGSSPNRTFVVQWSSFTDSSMSADLNFQIRLFEGSNSIRFVYGNCTTNQTIYPQIGLRGSIDPQNFQTRIGTFNNWGNTLSGSSASSRFEFQPSQVPPSGLTFEFLVPIPPPCETPITQAGNLQLSPGFNFVQMNYSAAQGASRYLIVRTLNVPLNALPVDGTNYAIGDVIGNGVVATYTTFLNPSISGLQENTNYRFYIFPAHAITCLEGPKYNISLPLNGSVRTRGARQYTFLPQSGSANFRDSLNWSPVRSNPRANDTLLFLGGNNVNAFVDQLAYEIAGRIVVGNNGDYTLQFIDEFYIRNSLLVEEGSTLSLNYTNPGTISLINFSTSASSQAQIDGRLNLTGQTVLDISEAEVTVNGTVSQGSNFCNILNLSENAPNNLLFGEGSYYLHNRNGGNIPLGNYAYGSHLELLGVTTTNPYFSPQIQSVGHLKVNCFSLVFPLSFDDNLHHILNSLTIEQTGNPNGQLLLDSLIIHEDLIQNGGVLNFSSDSFHVNVNRDLILNSGVLLVSSLDTDVMKRVLSIGGSIQKSTSHLISQNNSSPNGSIVFRLNGQSPQQINFLGSGNFGKVNYHFTNPSEIQITGTLPINHSCFVWIENGLITGNGSINYNLVHSRLILTGNNQLTLNDVIFPNLNGPTSCKINLTGSYPLNVIELHNNREIDSLWLQQGILQLDDYNLRIKKRLNHLNASQDRMILTNGTGMLLHNLILTSSSTAYLLPLGRPGSAPIRSFITVEINSNSVNRTLSARAISGQHPEALPGNSMQKYWQLSVDVNTPAFQYKLSSNDTEDDLGSDLAFLFLQSWDGLSWNNHSAVSNISSFSTPFISSSQFPLSTRDFTIQTSPSRTYTWTGLVSNDFNLPANWNPNRVSPDIIDILEFSDGLIDTITHIPAQAISGLRIFNQTTVLFNGASGILNPGLSVSHLYQPDSIKFKLEEGSVLSLRGDSSATNLSLIQGNYYVHGTLELHASNFTAKVPLNNAQLHILPGAIMRTMGTGSGAHIVSNGAAIYMGGTYHHRRTSTIDLPLMNWSNSSELIFTHLANTNSLFCNFFADSISRFTYDCPLQTGNLTLSTSIAYPLTILDSCLIKSTGTGTFQFGSSSGYTIRINNYLQTGGIVSLNSSSGPTATRVLEVYGSFNHVAGTFDALANTSVSPVLAFTGNNARQIVRFKSNAPTGGITYRISNPFGISIIGESFSTNEFWINGTGGVEIQTAEINPIESDLNLVYNPAGLTSLTYTYNDTLIARDYEFPETNGPYNLRISSQNNNVLILPFNRTVPGAFTLGGQLILLDKELTLGVSPTLTGSLNVIGNNSFIHLTSGKFRRWFKNSSNPLSFLNNSGLFPIKSNLYNCSISLSFETATSLSNPGTIEVSIDNQSSGFQEVEIVDGSDTIQSKWNPRWNLVAGNGFTMQADRKINLQINSGFPIQSSSASNLRILCGDSVSGTHLSSSQTLNEYTVARSLMIPDSLFQNPITIGSIQPGIIPHISIASGSWHQPEIWNVGTVPIQTSDVFIGNGTTVTIDDTAACEKLTVLTTATAQINDDLLQVNRNLQNLGNLKIEDGHLQLGPFGGGNRLFENHGFLIINSGLCEINGALILENGSSLEQNDGELLIDPNSNNIPEQSIINRSAFLIKTHQVLLDGGITRIVDPRPSLNTPLEHLIHLRVDLGILPSGNEIIAGPNHKFILGDGISDDGFIGQNFDNYNGFQTSSYVNGKSTTLILNDLEVIGTPNVVNRRFYASNSIIVRGDLTLINEDAYFSTPNLNLAGNLSLDSASYFHPSNVKFTNIIAGQMVPVDHPQIVSGLGRFGNNAIHTFYDITINNTSPEGVLMQIGNIQCELFPKLLLGKLDLDSSSITITSTVPNNMNYLGWIKGEVLLQFYNFGGSITSFIPVGTDSSRCHVELTGSQPLTFGMLRVHLKEGDHPQIISSNIDPDLNVNLHWEFEALNGLTFHPNTKLKLNWTNQDVDTNLPNQGLTISRKWNNAWSFITPQNLDSTSVLTFPLGNGFVGDLVVGSPNLIPFFSIQPQPISICSGTATTLSVGVQAAFDTSISYQWQKLEGSEWINQENSQSINGANTSELVFDSVSFMNQALYRCVVSVDENFITSNEVILQIQPSIDLDLVIFRELNGSGCIGKPEQFFSFLEPMNENLSVDWYVNNQPFLSSSDSLFLPLWNNTDKIHFLVQPEEGCYSQTVFSSDTIQLNGILPVLPNIQISLNAEHICSFSPLEATAEVEFVGENPQYFWVLNGDTLSGGNTFSNPPIANNSNLTCYVISDFFCQSDSIGIANSIDIEVLDEVIPQIQLNSPSGTNICEDEVLTFNSFLSQAGNNPEILWYQNNELIADSITFISVNNFNDGDRFYATVLGSTLCASPTLVYSDTLQINVTENVFPEVSIIVNPGTQIEPNTIVSFTASVTNGGQFPYFRWWRNGIPVSNNQEFVSQNWQNGDQIQLEFISSLPCASPSSLFSEVFEMEVFTGIKSQTKNEIKLYPNPASSYLNIDKINDNSNEIELIQLLDLQGRFVHEWKLGQVVQFPLTLMLPEVSEGLYLLRISGTKNTEVISLSIHQDHN